MQIDERVDAYLKELERSDDQDHRGTVGGAHAEALAAKIAARKQRKLRYEGFQAQLRSSGQAQRSLTDPESRAMKRGKGRGTEVCYNVQTAVDAKHTRIVACEVTNDPGDRDWLQPDGAASQRSARLPLRRCGGRGLLPWARGEGVSGGGHHALCVAPDHLRK